MKLLVGIVAGYIWCVILNLLMTKGGLQISNDTLIMTTAIIAAGAMAGEK